MCLSVNVFVFYEKNMSAGNNTVHGEKHGVCIVKPLDPVTGTFSCYSGLTGPDGEDAASIILFLKLCE